MGRLFYFLTRFLTAALFFSGVQVMGEASNSSKFSSSKISNKKPSKDELKAKLTPQQYTCTQEEGTEQPFQNAYWNHKADGIYVDLISGDPLFSSLDKYDSGSGWPSFTKSINQTGLIFKSDRKLGVERTEVRSKEGDAHLGHIFDDGPREVGGKRYCMNSASLDFIPLEKLKQKGHGKYLFQFAKKKGWEI